MEKQPPKKPRLKGEERRRQILRIAMELFSNHGFRGTTLRQLARRAGISEAMIYHHFPSKEALYDAILEKRIEDTRHLFFPVDAARAKQDRMVFETIVGNFLQRQAQDSSFMRMILFSALEGHELAHKFVNEPLQSFFHFLGSYMDERIKEGEFKPVSGQIAARVLMGMAFHLSLLREIFQDPGIEGAGLDELTSTAVDLFFEGIKQTGAGKDPIEDRSC